MTLRRQTILCGEIGGNTDLWRAFKAMQEAQPRYAALMQQIITAYDGAFVNDPASGIAGLFEAPLNAIWAAVEAQRRLQSEHWPGIGRLPMRVALHSRASASPGAHPSGPMLQQALKLLAVGQAGQILLSHDLALLVCDLLPAELELRELDGYHLLGLEYSQTVFRLITPEHGRLAPPPPHVRAMPLPLAPLVGRSGEHAIASRLLARPDGRLLTLCGPAGVGKTRLAQELASSLAPLFRDGVCFVPLEATPDASLMVNAIAEQLEISLPEEHARPDELHDHLRDRELLLILDGVQHLLAGLPLIVELLARAPLVRCLITSRDPLDLPAEQSLRIEPLELPTLADSFSTSQALQYSSMRLLVERTRTCWPEFELTAEQVGPLVEICQLLDGLPLALELAAVYLKIFPPRAMAAQLRGYAELRPDESLLRTLDWLYGLLSETERRLFVRLGIFCGSWDLEAAETICNDQLAQTAEPGPVVALLLALIGKGLIRQYTSGEARRFSMADSVRAYALGRLAEQGEGQQLRRKHALYYLNIAEHANEGLKTAQQFWLERLDLERNNLYAAFHWTLEHGEQELLLRFCVVPWRYWGIYDSRNEVLGWLERAVSGNRVPTGPNHAEMLCLTGWMAFDRADYELAQRFFDESLALARQFSAPRQIALALHGVGELYFRHGNVRQALASFEESLEIFRQLNDSYEIAWSLNHLARVLQHHGQAARAQAALEEGLIIFHTLDAQWAECFALNHLGLLALEQGRPAEALQRLESALKLAQALDDPRHIARTDQHMALALIALDDLSRASELLGQALALVREVGSQVDLATSLEVHARLALAQQQPREAAWLLASAERLREQIGEHSPLVDPEGYPLLLAQLRRQLAVEFEQRWQQGRAMSPEQSFASAQLTAAPRPLPQPDQAEISGEQLADIPLGLTLRELEILRLVARGLTNSEIAQQLHLSPHTVNNHLRSIYRKLNVTTRLAASRVALEHHLV